MALALASDTTALDATARYLEVGIDALFPSPLNPRQHFDDLDDLAANIRVHGVLVPLLVRRRRNVTKSNGGHAEWTSLEIVDGERRFRATRIDSPTCEHSVLGVVVVGPGYGTAYPVCIARDRCTVHWKAEIREREKRAKERATETPAKRTAKKEESWEERQKREEAERARQVAAYKAVYTQFVEAISGAVPTEWNDALRAYLWSRLEMKGQPPKALDAFMREVILADCDPNPPAYWVKERLDDLVEIGKQLGVHTETFKSAYTKHLAAARKADPAKAKATPVKPAKKATTKKAVKKGGPR